MFLLASTRLDFFEKNILLFSFLRVVLWALLACDILRFGILRWPCARPPRPGAPAFGRRRRPKIKLQNKNDMPTARAKRFQKNFRAVAPRRLGRRGATLASTTSIRVRICDCRGRVRRPRNRRIDDCNLRPQNARFTAVIYGRKMAGLRPWFTAVKCSIYGRGLRPWILAPNGKLTINRYFGQN